MENAIRKLAHMARSESGTISISRSFLFGQRSHQHFDKNNRPRLNGEDESVWNENIGCVDKKMNSRDSDWN